MVEIKRRTHVPQQIHAAPAGGSSSMFLLVGVAVGNLTDNKFQILTIKNESREFFILLC